MNTCMYIYMYIYIYMCVYCCLFYVLCVLSVFLFTSTVARDSNVFLLVNTPDSGE